MSRHTDAIAGYKDRLIHRIGNLSPGVASELRNIKLPWYVINNADGDPNQGNVPEDEAEVLIYDEIGGSLGVNANDFITELGAITAPNIRLRINSPGGSLFDSIAIHNALVQHPSFVTVYVDSLAASGASIVAMSGDRVVMMPGSQMMIHDALGMEMGNAADMRAMSTFLDRQSDNIADIYAGRAGGDPADWRERMLAETWMFAREAVELGLADEVYVKPQGEDDEDEPMPDEPDTPEEDDEDEEDSTEANAATVREELENLMKRQHSLRNRNFKYPNRERAGSPFARKVAAANMLALREILGG